MGTKQIVEEFFNRKMSINFGESRYKDDYAKFESLTKEIGVNPELFLSGIFYPRLSEQLTNFRIRPRHLSSKWAILKFKHWLLLSKEGNLSPYSMEAEFVKHSKKIANEFGQKDYFKGELTAPVLSDIRKRNVSILYCALNPLFMSMYKSLPNDIKEEYFDQLDLYYLGIQAKVSKQIVDAYEK